MKVGIIGGNSFLGRHIVEQLSSINQISLLVWTRKGNGSSPHNIKYCIFDHPIIPIKTNELLECETIFYCVGSGIQPGRPSTYKELYGLNLFEPIQIINKLQKKEFKGNFISFGSYFEIGINSQKTEYKEDEVMNTGSTPFNEYSITKRLLTKFIASKLKSNPDLNLSHFILPNIYGENENKQRLIPYLVQQIKSGKEIEMGSGDQVRQYLYVNEISIFFKSFLSKNKNLRGIYNLSGNELISIRQIVEQLIDYSKEFSVNIPEVSFNQVMKQDAAAPYLALNGEKSKQELEWHPTTTIADIIPEYFAKNYEE